MRFGSEAMSKAKEGTDWKGRASAERQGHLATNNGNMGKIIRWDYKWDHEVLLRLPKATAAVFTMADESN
jgi:hypothetical protein